MNVGNPIDICSKLRYNVACYRKSKNIVPAGRKTGQRKRTQGRKMNEIGKYMKKIHILMERQRNIEYRGYDLTSTQIDIMEYLYFNCDGKNTLSDIAAFFGVQHTSVIHVLKILEKKELIYRKESPKDCRCKAILLTQKGRDIIHSHLGCPAARNAFLYAGISEAELEITEKSLRQIYQNLLQNQTDGFHTVSDGKTTIDQGTDENAEV